MSSATLLKCTQTHCTFETKRPVELSTHLQKSTTDGSRWKCIGPGCNAVYCSAQAISVHHHACSPYKAFEAKRKYGTDLNGRLGPMSFSTAGQMNGTEPDGPPPGFSTPNRKAAVKKNGSARASKSKRSRAKSPKSYATPKQSTTSKPSAPAPGARKPRFAAKRYNTVTDSESEDDDGGDDGDFVWSSTPARKTRVTRKPRWTLKSKAVDEGDTKDGDDNDSDVGDALKPMRSVTPPYKGRTTRNSLAAMKRKAADEDENEEEDNGLTSKKNTAPSRKSPAKRPVSNKRPKVATRSESKPKKEDSAKADDTSFPPDPFSPLALAQSGTQDSFSQVYQGKGPFEYDENMFGMFDPSDASAPYTPFDAPVEPFAPSFEPFSAWGQPTPYKNTLTPYKNTLTPYKYQSSPFMSFTPFVAQPSALAGAAAPATEGKGDGDQLDPFEDPEDYEIMQ